MGYDGKALKKARERLESIRGANETEHERRVAEVYARVPRIADIDARLRRQMAELARLAFSREADRNAQLALLRHDNLELQAERAELLVGNGWPMDYLDEIVSCPICRDSGNADGKMCVCLKKFYNAALTEELSGLLRDGSERFENFDLRLYPDVPDAGGNVPRAVMTEVLALSKEYAAAFPKVSSDLLMQGGPGLGKTFLSACIARAVAERGYSVCYDSVSAALEAFETRRFARESEAGEDAERRVQQMLACDLLILDDLGTEFLTPVSASALYTLVNTRLANGRRSIVSTNLSDEELANRYGPQLFSRLKGAYKSLPFRGQDIRLMKK